METTAIGVTLLLLGALLLVGEPGIGKSRLANELVRTVGDEANALVGRCLAYGEGVTYWALADMVRMRCQIAEDEQPESARRKLRATLEEHLLALYPTGGDLCKSD